MAWFGSSGESVPEHPSVRQLLEDFYVQRATGRPD